jgi:hypothetical protein
MRLSLVWLGSRAKQCFLSTPKLSVPKCCTDYTASRITALCMFAIQTVPYPYTVYLYRRVFTQLLLMTYWGIAQTLQPQMLLMNRELYASAAATNNLALSQQVSVRNATMCFLLNICCFFHVLHFSKNWSSLLVLVRCVSQPVSSTVSPVCMFRLGLASLRH